MNQDSDDLTSTSDWITYNEFRNEGIFGLYAISVYFTMQTLTTVGYGDVSIPTSQERFFIIMVQFIGIIFFSFASGSLTNIIANYDSNNAVNQQKT